MPSSGPRYALFAPLAIALLSAVSSGCTSSVIFEDGEPNCEAYPFCDPGDEEVGECPADGDCYEASLCGATILCAAVQNQCNAYPACNPGDEEVAMCPLGASCYEAEACGNVIVCQELAQCDGYPSCDPDDIDVTAQGCPLDASCYEASLCGSTILCMDQGLPHGCPELKPADGQPCDFDEQYGVMCDYFDANGCFETVACQVTGEDKPPEWVFIGGGCGLGDGGTGGNGGT